MRIRWNTTSMCMFAMDLLLWNSWFWTRRTMWKEWSMVAWMPTMASIRVFLLPWNVFGGSCKGKTVAKYQLGKCSLTRLRDRAHMHLSRVRRSWCHCTYCLSYCRLLSVKHDIVFCHLQVIIILLTLPIDIRDRRSKQEYLCLHFLGLTLPPLSQYEPQNQR